MGVYRFFLHEHIRKYGFNVVWNGQILILLIVLLHCIMTLGSTHKKTLIFISMRQTTVKKYLVG